MTVVKKCVIGIFSIMVTLYAPGAVARSEVQRYMLNGWIIAVSRDNFAVSVHCSLTSNNGQILYQPAAMGFRFSRGNDTQNAVYRIDGEAPQRWQDRYPTLIASGAQIDGAGLDSPTDGIVWLPIDQVIRARRVAMRLTPHSKVKSFALRGFADMLAAAQRLGCSIPSSFVN